MKPKVYAAVTQKRENRKTTHTDSYQALGQGDTGSCTLTLHRRYQDRSKRKNHNLLKNVK